MVRFSSCEILKIERGKCFELFDLNLEKEPDIIGYMKCELNFCLKVEDFHIISINVFHFYHYNRLKKKVIYFSLLKEFREKRVF